MSEDKNGKLLMAFLAGAAVGAAIGYFLNSDKKDELVEDIKEGAASLKQVIDESLDKVKDIIGAFTEQDSEPDTEITAKS
jgi:gas vesicle protein